MIAAKRVTSVQDAASLLNCRRLPGRLNTTEAAVLLGFQEHDISTLVAAKCLSPLGRPAPNAPKYFAAVDVLAFAQDRDWLDRATKALAKFWLDKNHGKSAKRVRSISLADNRALKARRCIGTELRQCTA
jgi:hypothetical protein